MFEFFFDWFLLILSVVFLFPAFYCNENRLYGQSTIWMFVSIGLMGWFFNDKLLAMVESYGIIKTGVYCVFGYVIMGAITAGLFWISYTRRAGEKYNEIIDQARNSQYQYQIKTENPILRDLHCKWDAIRDISNLREIFDDRECELSYKMTLITPNLVSKVEQDPTEDNTQRLIEELETSIKSVLPPRFKTCKPFIYGAGYSWPITLVWLLFSRLIKQLIDGIISMFGGVFNKVSALMFGRI
jgi:hypothetical protein